MPDWSCLVRRKLGSAALPPDRLEEIVLETAGFLEDLYEERLGLGESPRTAQRVVLARAGRFSDLARELERVEGSMRRRLKTLWLPGLGVSVVTMGLLLVVSHIGTGELMVWYPFGAPVGFYWPWTVALPLLGAAGTAWSRRAGGVLLERLLVALFPALALLALFTLGFLLVLLRPDNVPAGEKLPILLVGMLTWVALPAAALLLGGLPLLRARSRT